jgi:hypothetical protein
VRFEGEKFIMDHLDRNTLGVTDNYPCTREHARYIKSLAASKLWPAIRKDTVRFTRTYSEQGGDIAETFATFDEQPSESGRLRQILDMTKMVEALSD